MRPKGDGCYSVTKAELLTAMRAGAVLWWGKFGPYLRDEKGRQLHPRRDTLRRLIASGVLEWSGEENATQRACGMATLRLAAAATKGERQ